MAAQQHVLAWIILGVVCLIKDSQCQTHLPVYPEDTAVGVGDNVQFFCRIEGVDVKQEAVVWTRQLSGSKDVEMIYKTYPVGEVSLDETKYTFEKTGDLETNLIVKNIQLGDAGAYKCAPMTSPDKGKAGELVVVDNPDPSIQNPLYDQKTGKMTCIVRYRATATVKDSTTEPELFAKIGTLNLDTTNVVKSDPTGADQDFMLTLDYEDTMNRQYHGENFTCGAEVPRTGFTINTMTTIEIHYDTDKVEILSSERHLYYPEDTINCTANGFPAPSISWVPYDSHGAASRFENTEAFASLTVTKEMVGNNTWVCKAQQAGKQAIEQRFSFSVVSPTDIPAGESTGADTTVIAIAVAVPVGVLLVVLVVVCIVCKKRKSNGGAAKKPKRGEAVEGGAPAGKPRNQIYKPVATKPEQAQVSIEEERASYRAKNKSQPPPTAAPRTDV